MSRFHLAVCEIYNTRIHGGYMHNIGCEGHYLVIYTHLQNNRFGPTEVNYESDTSDDDDVGIISGNDHWELNCIVELYRQKYREITPSHSFIRNYRKMIKDKNYIQPEIIQRIHLENQCVVAIKKTFWIRIIQRVWKRVYAEKCRILKMYKNPSYLSKREQNIKWRIKLPTLYGMLQNI